MSSFYCPVCHHDYCTCKLLTVKEVADRYGVLERQVIYAIKSNKLYAAKKGWQWFLNSSLLPENFPVKTYKTYKIKETNNENMLRNL